MSYYTGKKVYFTYPSIYISINLSIKHIIFYLSIYLYFNKSIYQTYLSTTNLMLIHLSILNCLPTFPTYVCPFLTRLVHRYWGLVYTIPNRIFKPTQSRCVAVQKQQLCTVQKAIQYLTYHY